MAIGTPSVELTSAGEKAGREIMRSLGHRPERKTEESFRDTMDIIVLHCRDCNAGLKVRVTVGKVTILWTPSDCERKV